jgi:hypothetical protein
VKFLYEIDTGMRMDALDGHLLRLCRLGASCVDRELEAALGYPRRGVTQGAGRPQDPGSVPTRPTRRRPNNKPELASATQIIGLMTPRRQRTSVRESELPYWSVWP